MLLTMPVEKFVGRKQPTCSSALAQSSPYKMIKFFSGPPMHNRSLKMIGVKNGRNIDLQLKPISSGDLVVTVSKDQSISQHSKEEH